MLQCLRHYASNAGGIGLIPWSENSYHTRCVVWQKIKKTNLKSIHPFYNFWVLTAKEIEHIFKCLMAFLFLLLWFSSVQSLRRVWLFVTPWTAACQAYLSITNSPSLLKLMSIQSVMSSNHLILCSPLLLLTRYQANIADSPPILQVAKIQVIFLGHW